LSRANADRDLALDGLRGIAAMAVVIHHLVGRQGLYANPDVEGWLALGSLGVDVFFVISGFIIPSLLLKTQPGARLSLRFLLRRLVRLLPPYWLAVVFSALSLYVAGSALSAGVAEPAVWLCHLSQSCGSLKITWWNGVFWSLPVEIQFYAIAAVAVPIALTLTRPWRFAIGALMLLAAVRSPDSLAFQYAPLFMAGIVALAWREGGLKGWQLVASLGLIVLSHTLAFGLRPSSLLVTLATVAILIWSPRGLRVLAPLGVISYSLYLLHVPVGYRLLDWGTQAYPLRDNLGSTLIALSAIGASLVMAIGFYFLIEHPSIRWARKVKL